MRRCDGIGKEAFQIHDAVEFYASLQSMTEIRPMVVDPQVGFDTLVK